MRKHVYGFNWGMGIILSLGIFIDGKLSFTQQFIAMYNFKGIKVFNLKSKNVYIFYNFDLFKFMFSRMPSYIYCVYCFTLFNDIIIFTLIIFQLRFEISIGLNVIIIIMFPYYQVFQILLSYYHDLLLLFDDFSHSIVGVS